MTIRRYTDRSRVETYLRCPRRRFLEYHESETGIQPAKKNIHLAVGGAVHSGLESLLRAAMLMEAATLAGKSLPVSDWQVNQCIEDAAVDAALADFSQFAGKLEGDEIAAPSNLVQIAGTAALFDVQLMQQALELGLDPSDFRGPLQQERQSRAERYLFDELSALVEALVRAYARRRLRPLLEEFEVLEVEQEGEWKLAEWGSPGYSPTLCPRCQVGKDTDGDGNCAYCAGMTDESAKIIRVGREKYELWFLSRPDALLRHRQTNELQLLSFKTTGGWDLRKARDIQHDMQGLSEGVEVERRLERWWHQVNPKGRDFLDIAEGRLTVTRETPITDAMTRFLSAVATPPRVSAIRYEFLLKGERWKDKDLSAQLGVEARVQKSHLIYQYVATSTPKTGKNTESFRVGDVCWSWEFTRVEDQQSSKLYAGNWRPRPVWEGGTGAVRDWIDKLDRSELCMSGEDSTVGMEPRPLGFKSDAQTMGVTIAHPLDSVFVPPVTVYRQDDQLLDWVEQIVEVEKRNAEAVMEVAGVSDAGEKRSQLNRLFPQHRGACEYPTQCWAARERVGVCWGGAEMQARPLEVGGGEYMRRVPNHPAENAERAGKGDGKL